ncbi:molybdopterin molybdotransferase MoeA [Desulfogranum japonicum]|uniref:molybdopterin molybdotransferase MoeA n=1 Tax=Desulfogranum japonicum TaxID=231447 RepID=UPI0003FE723B|nr:gephyrin-like molybdotransferase Glp [Desulfogranum japonicum]
MKDFFTLTSPSDVLKLYQHFTTFTEENVPLSKGLGRILSKNISAPENLPPFARSTMDGFAVRAKNTFGCSESEPALLNITGEIAMGDSGQQHMLASGDTMQIWTGGELPRKADSVCMIEYSRKLDDQTVELYRPVAPGENVIQAGDDFAQGSPVLSQGKQLRPQDLGILAGLGITNIPVYRKPVVAILSTGDELIPPDAEPSPGKIRDINSTTLAALVEEAGATAINLGIQGDDFDGIRDCCADALEQVDLVLLSGGSSVGRRDFTLDVFKSLPRAEILVHGISVRPGKPTIVARMDNKALIGLPGHVGSAMVIFYLFVRPLLHHFTGQGINHGLRAITALTGEQIPSAIGREEYVRVRIEPAKEPGHPPVIFPVYGKSGLLKPLVLADGLLPIGRDVEGLDKGIETCVLLFP